jgi:phenylalanyl-tRNA synthetase beta chain
MRVSTNWLRGLTQIDAPPDEIARRLTSAGVAVDAVRRVGTGLDHVVLATVESSQRHAERDGLTVVQVHDGTRAVVLVGACL